MSLNLMELGPDRRRDIEIAKILGYSVIETDDCNGNDNLWLSIDGHSPAKNDAGDDLDVPFFSTMLQDAIALVEHLANASNEGGPEIQLTFRPRRAAGWSFRIGTVEKAGTDVPFVVTEAVLAYFKREVES